MFDPLAQGLAAVDARSAYAAPLAFASGLVSSIGPCMAPRFLAIAGLAGGKPRAKGFTLVFSFISGIVLVYAAFGAASSLFREAARYSAWTYGVVALALAVGGTLALWRDDECGCRRPAGFFAGAGAGAAFLLGASFALVVSPCCAPLVVGILAYTSASGDVLYSSFILACFALGHVLPILAAAFGVNGATAIFQRYTVRAGATVVSASLMLGLAGYYAVLA